MSVALALGFTDRVECGLLEEMWGKQPLIMRSTSEPFVKYKLCQAEARIKLLVAENKLLKKLERQASKILTPSENFELINQTLRMHDLHRVTRYLCQVAEVSASGYYRWCNAET